MSDTRNSPPDEEFPERDPYLDRDTPDYSFPEDYDEYPPEEPLDYDYPDQSDQEPTNDASSENGNGGVKSKLGEGVGNLKDKAIGNAKEAASDKLKESVPGVGSAVDTAEKIQERASFAKNLWGDLKQSLSVFKSIGSFLANPAVYITAAVSVIVIMLVVTIMAMSHVYGQTKSEVDENSGGGLTVTAGAMQQRLAQRAEWLQNNYKNYGNSNSAALAVGGPGVAANGWAAACPQIVQLIYGLSPYLNGYMGSVNAYNNYKAHPDMYEAWAFSNRSGTYGAYGDGSKSEGAELLNPPPGAIVSIENEPMWYSTCCVGAGHTFVMLTDELVIDNFSGGGIYQAPVSGGPRVLSDTMRSHIVGWALPKSEGFEGTAITGSFDGAAPSAKQNQKMPGLGPVPSYMGEVVEGDDDSPVPHGDFQLGDAPPLPDKGKRWLKAAGIPEKYWHYVNFIAFHESSWNPDAVNPNGGACGLIQMLPCNKEGVDSHDPVENLKWAHGYAERRYGGWEGAYDFWVSNHWW